MCAGKRWCRPATAPACAPSGSGGASGCTAPPLLHWSTLRVPPGGVRRVSVTQSLINLLRRHSFGRRCSEEWFILGGIIGSYEECSSLSALIWADENNNDKNDKSSHTHALFIKLRAHAQFLLATPPASSYVMITPGFD